MEGDFETYYLTTHKNDSDMKGTDHFKRTIQMYLEQRAEEDTLFAKNYRNPAKNIDDCVTYILNYVQKSGCNGFTDGEIYGQAVHYYDENEIEVGNIFEYMVETYLNGNMSVFRGLYHELNKNARKDFIDFLLSEVEPIYWREILKHTI